MATRISASHKSRCLNHLRLDRRESPILAILLQRATLRGWPSEPDATGSPILARTLQRATPPPWDWPSVPENVTSADPGEAAQFTLGAACTVMHKTCNICASCSRHCTRVAASWYGIEGTTRFVPLWKWLTRACP